MSANLHSVSRSLIWGLLVIMLTAALTILGAGASAQTYGTGPTSSLPPSPAGNDMSSGTYGLPTQPGLLMEPRNASQTPPNATLLGVPVYGTAPLTVDFYVGIANPRGPLVYRWNFGDGVVVSLPAGAYVLHVYWHPGTYLCSLNLATAQGRSTTLLTTIIVRSSHR
jgi:PKD repeat protein